MRGCQLREIESKGRHVSWADREVTMWLFWTIKANILTTANMGLRATILLINMRTPVTSHNSLISYQILKKSVTNSNVFELSTNLDQSHFSSSNRLKMAQIWRPGILFAKCHFIIYLFVPVFMILHDYHAKTINRPIWVDLKRMCVNLIPLGKW